MESSYRVFDNYMDLRFFQLFVIRDVMRVLQIICLADDMFG